MPDRVSRKVRSRIMASVGSTDTGPELKLRKALHAVGFRYRTDYAKLPGKPDLAFPKLRKAIFVHGCFWHGHSCRWGRLPKSRPEFWRPKILKNRERDARVLRAVRRAGWSVMVVWQCQLRDLEARLPRIVRFLRKRRKNTSVRVVSF